MAFVHTVLRTMNTRGAFIFVKNRSTASCTYSCATAATWSRRWHGHWRRRRCGWRGRRRRRADLADFAIIHGGDSSSQCCDDNNKSDRQFAEHSVITVNVFIIINLS